MLTENVTLRPQNFDSVTDDMLDYAKQLGFGELHFKIDAQNELEAIIAIHSTKLGSALGGCRFREYASVSDAAKDAMRLAQGMSYKAAISNLPLGGGKAVLIKPAQLRDRAKYFHSFGEFIETFNGRYITAVDSGTSPEDMDLIAERTSHVTSTSTDGDPSPYTAKGVRSSIEAAVLFKLGKKDLAGLHVAIQGVGHVGYYLAKELHERGVKLTVTDVSTKALQRCREEFNAAIVSPEEIYRIPCDVFAPCALGAVINDITLPLFNTTIIIGAANNQLAEPHHGELLHQKGILYGPDYVINAGGLIHASAHYFKHPIEEVVRQVNNIHHTALMIFERSAMENRPTNIIADAIALERIHGGRK